MEGVRSADPAGVTEILTGVDALARLLVLRSEVDEAAGLRTGTLVSGYPGSPLGDFDLAVERLGGAVLRSRQIVHRPAVNEELAAAAVWGSQMGAAVAYRDVDGVAGVWYGKSPGVDRAGDVMRHANFMGVGPNGAAVMFVGDDPGAKSSTLPCDSQRALADAAMPILVPGNQQETIELGLHAFRLSRHAGTWVGLRMVTAVADGLGSVDLDIARTSFATVPVAGQHQAVGTIIGVPNQERAFLEDRLIRAEFYLREYQVNVIQGSLDGPDVAIIVAGKTYYDLVQILRENGIEPAQYASRGIRVIKLGATYPISSSWLLGAVHAARKCIVIEEKRAFVETQVRSVLHEAASTLLVEGKRDAAGEPLVPINGEVSQQILRSVLARSIPDIVSPALANQPRQLLTLVQPPGRSPAYCSGCPHNRSTIAPAGALVGGGVGCHGMVYYEPRHRGERMIPPTPMGLEGAPWIGLEPFVTDQHSFQNMGDGTFAHSGTLAIRAAIAANVNMTFKLLYNSAVAMTGGQNVAGQLEIPALTRLLDAEGVRHVVVVSDDVKRYPRRSRWAKGVRVVPRDRLAAAQEDMASKRGVSVIIYDQQCAAEARRLRRRGQLPDPPRRVVINDAVCEGCGDCNAKSNCLSVETFETEFGDKRRINQSSCNKDYTCLEGNCPSFMTFTSRHHMLRRSSRRHGMARLLSGDLSSPRPRQIRQMRVYTTGIGGTGIVTLHRVLAEAARIDGMFVRGLDQTGMSQKAGAVVSHLHIATAPEQLDSSSVGDGTADLYLSGDILQAAAPLHLIKAGGSALAVVESQLSPTIEMMQARTEPVSLDGLEAALADRFGRDRTVIVNAREIAQKLLGTELAGNIVLLGCAFQRGALPMSESAILAAIRTHTSDESLNADAFRLGRWYAQDSEAVLALLRARSSQSAALDPGDRARATSRALIAGSSLPAPARDLVQRRTAQVAEYQGGALARRYLELVELAVASDSAEHGWALTTATAESWFKLLTYKDEYEVARLHLAFDRDGAARDLGFDGGYRVKFHLQPPLLEKFGLHRKITVGSWFILVFAALRAARHLRGTILDVFGLLPSRRLERSLIREFEALMYRYLPTIADGAFDYDTAVELANSPRQIRGFESVKEVSVARWRAKVAVLTGSNDVVEGPDLAAEVGRC